MILTLKSYVQRERTIAEKSIRLGKLGTDKPRPPIAYSKVGMWSVLVFSCGLAITGLILCLASAVEQNIGAVVVGVLMVLIGNYVLIAAVKEKANLDLFADHLANLTPETQDELLRRFFEKSLDSGGGILRLIETILNVIFKKAEP